MAFCHVATIQWLGLEIVIFISVILNAVHATGHVTRGMIAALMPNQLAVFVSFIQRQYTMYIIYYYICMLFKGHLILKFNVYYHLI